MTETPDHVSQPSPPVSAFQQPADTFEQVKAALAELDRTETVVYLPDFECCGTCAWYRLANDDWGKAKGFAMFHEQTGDHAVEQSELYVITGAFVEDSSSEDARDEADEAVKVLVQEALLAGGFKLLQEEEVESYDWDFRNRNFIPGYFFKTNSGFGIWGNFEEREELSAMSAMLEQLQDWII